MKLTFAVIASCMLLASPLGAQTNFYQGKTITFIIGSGAGTAYDIYGRLQANHISKYLPGNPKRLF